MNGTPADKKAWLIRYVTVPVIENVHTDNQRRLTVIVALCKSSM